MRAWTDAQLEYWLPHSICDQERCVLSWILNFIFKTFARMHVTAITCCVCLLPILASSIPTADDYSSSSSDYQSSADYAPLMPVEAFALNDKNGDGLITPKEYKKANPDISDVESRHIFSNFDLDKDGKISLSEFTSGVQHDDPPKPQENCLTSLMRTCSREFIDAVQNWGNKQGDAMCHCLPVYRDCIRHESAACSAASPSDLEEEVLNGQVDALLRRFRKSLCQDAYSRARLGSAAVFTTSIPASLTSEAVPRGLRQVRSTRQESRRDRPRSRRQSCIVPTMRPCNNVFVSALQAQEEDPCHSLVKYRHCVHKSTRRCSDPNIPHIQRAIKFLTKEHRRVKLCSKYVQ